MSKYSYQTGATAVCQVAWTGRAAMGLEEDRQIEDVSWKQKCEKLLSDWI